MSVEAEVRVWRGSAAGGSGRLVLLALADWANSDGVCWPSMEALSRKVRLGERQVRRLVAGLVAGGDLELLKGGGRCRTNAYWVKAGLPPDTVAPWGKVSSTTGFRRENGVAEYTVPTGNRVTGDRAIKEEPSEENPRIPYTGNLPPNVLSIDAQLRGLPGYEPDQSFFHKVAEGYGDGQVDLEEQGIRIKDWFARHRRRQCTPAFVLGWLSRELHPERGYGRVRKGGAKDGHHGGVGRDGGLDALG